ncbi:MAG: aldo/keto reductase [bacterium]
MTLSGRATPDGTARYIQKLQTDLSENHFRSHRNLNISSLGLGTYLGEATEDHDSAYENAAIQAVRTGLNHLDTAINYRYQRSERSIGRALESLIEDGDFSRDEIIVATKAGFVPFDSAEPDDPMDYIRTEFIEPGVVSPHDFTRSGHCLKPDYLEHQLNKSLDNLGLETVDVFYIHNPETQLNENSYEDFLNDLEVAFERLEELTDDNLLSTYGIATWDGLRVDPEDDQYLKLSDVVQCARNAGGEDHSFQAVQLPFNLGMSEALTKGNQPLDDDSLTPLEACRQLNLMTVTSASLLQGRLANHLPDEIKEDLDEFDSNALRALQFTRSAPGVTSALVGMKSPEHLEENLSLAREAPFSSSEFTNRFLREVAE